MKFLKNILTASLVFAGLAAHAEGSLDLFGPVRVAVISPLAAQILGSTATGITNQPVLLRQCVGIAAVHVMDLTNNGATGLTLTLQTSYDTTNWNNLSNYAVGTLTSIITTNGYYGAPGLFSTNVEVRPGTSVNPVAGTAGFATPYLLPAAFTNSGAYSITTSNAVVAWGVRDQGTYLRAVWSFSGTTTNVYYGAELDFLHNQ
jgi:hypothetical protein